MAILKCENPKCISDFQDQRYGVKMRVHNPGVKVFRCTVCSCTVCSNEKGRVDKKLEPKGVTA